MSQKSSLMKTPQYVPGALTSDNGWLRLSQIALLHQGLSDAQASGAAAALLQSRAQSPFYAPLLWQQLEFALMLWPVLLPEQRRALAPQILTGAKLFRWRFVKIAARRHGAAAVRAVLAEDEVLLAAFDRHYLKMIKPRF